MKIVQAVHSFPPQIGGLERHVYELCRQLHECGEEVVVHTAGCGHGAAEPFRVERHWGLRFPFFSSVVWIPFLTLRLMLEDADIYASHGYGSLTPFCTAIAAFVRRKPFVFTVHGYPKLGGAGRIAQWIYSNTLARVILWVASGIIVVSGEAETYIASQADKRKIAYVPNGVDTSAFRCPPFKEEGYVSYIGRLDKDKRVEMLIGAAARMEKRQKLLIAGNDEGAGDGLVELARSRGVDAEFTQAEPVEAPRIYCRSKAVVLPSRYEGFSLVWLEAISCARPMFSSPVGQAPELFREVYGEHAEKFLFKNEAELAVRLDYFASHMGEFVPIVEAAREAVKREYSWGNVAKKTLEVYRRAEGSGRT